MKLRMLRESIATTTGAIALAPMTVLGAKKQKKPKKQKLTEGEKGASCRTGYLGISGQSQPTNSVHSVWQPLQQPTKKGQVQWEKKYAAQNNPDERLIKNFRGKGY